MTKHYEVEYTRRGTLEKVLEEMEVVLSNHYGEDWEYNFELEDGWVDLKLQVPSDKEVEGGNAND